MSVVDLCPYYAFDAHILPTCTVEPPYMYVIGAHTEERYGSGLLIVLVVLGVGPSGRLTRHTKKPGENHRTLLVTPEPSPESAEESA
jgi:hypothetical protein